jgi:predicted metalloprotease with PDZ domain
MVRIPMSKTKLLGWFVALALSGLAATAESPPAPDPVPVRESPRAWLGAWLGDAIDGGIQVVALVARGPAERAGLLPGDIIVEIDGQTVLDQDLLGRLLAGKQPGEEAALSVLRSGEIARFTLTLGERFARPAPVIVPRPARPAPPAPSAHAATRDRLQLFRSHLLEGLQVAEITPALREHYGAPADSGVLVLGVAANEARDESGLRVGDVLVRIGEQEIRNRRQLERTLATWRSEDPPQARILRDGEPRTVLIRRPATPAPVAAPEREFLQEQLSAEIERLERRLDQLRRQLAALSTAE